MVTDSKTTRTRDKKENKSRDRERGDIDINDTTGCLFFLSIRLDLGGGAVETMRTPNECGDMMMRL